MSDLRVITAAELLELSPRNPVTLQDGNMDVFEGIPFSSDEEAVRYRAAERSTTMGKLDIPLAMPMHGEFREPPAERPSIFEKLGIDIDLPATQTKDGETESSNRSNEDFRIVLPDREVAPTQNERCQVMPYVLFNGVTSIMLRVELVETERDMELFQHDSFWLNVYDKGASHPVNGVSDATLQVTLSPSNPSDAEKVVERYGALKEEAGRIIEGIINRPVPVESGA